MLHSNSRAGTFGIKTKEHSRARSRGWHVPFFIIWGGQTFSLVGSALVHFALIWWLTETTGSAAVLAMSSLVALLPPVVLGPLAGALVDRWNRRWIMVVADGGIAAFTAILALLCWRDSVQTWHIYAILFLRALGAAFHDPAMTASTTLMAPKEHLTRVAGMNETRQAITRIAVAPLSALLVVLLPIQGILAIDIVTALLAIGPLLFIVIPQPVTPQSSKSAPNSSTRDGGYRAVIHEIGDGFRYLWSWRGLFIAITTISLVAVFQQPATMLIPLLVRQHFGGGPAQWGWTTMAYNVGAVLGGILMSTWGGFRKRVMTMLSGLLLYGVVNLVRGLVPANALWLFIAVTFLAGPAIAMGFVSLKAILQSTVPPEMQGRVFSLQNSLLLAMGPLGLSVLGPLADELGIQPLYLITATACFAVAFVWLLTWSVRHLEDGPPAQATGSAGDRKEMGRI